MTDSSHGQPLHHHQDPSLTASNPHRWTPKHSPVPSKEPEDSDDQDPFQPIDSSPKQDLHPVSFIDATSDSYMSPTAVARSSPSSSPMPDSHPIQKRDSVDSQDSFRRDAAPTWKTMADYDSFASENDRDHSEEDTDSDDDQDDDSSSDLSTDSEDNNRRSINQGYLEGTQRLLASSSNVRRGGLGMGIRAGETGTGTMIGLDLGQSLSQRVYEDDDDRYEEGFHDTLPLTAMDAHQLDARLGQKKEEEKAMQQGTALGGSIRSKNKKGHGKRHGSSKRSKKSQRGEGGVEDDSRPGLEAGLGMSSEQAARLAKRQFRVQMVWNAFYVFACTKIMPCAIASGLDIGLSNNSLKTITLAFYTMCKSSSLAFVLLFAFIFRLEKPSWKYVGIIGVICMGLFMMVMSEVDFVLIG
ncbi:Triose-phosphate Transporter [Lunasporangiospora selenospora]|uniref:Triose-phosphate Transporter n=1 Tax=Lunasporangiospora selenospora TaxID=979761 RepID=A0A9P6FTZ5_9FUNG|nr:Triose-phosphate Transporter [Lunasporangiospora selenospora]